MLVNNAGVSRPIAHADLAAAAPAQWRELLEVNLIAPWTLVTAAADTLARSDREGGGAIVNITSHTGVRPKGASIPYAASKAALNHVTLLLAAALGPSVRVNAVAPGLVDTPLTRDWTDAHALWADAAPMRRAPARRRSPTSCRRCSPTRTSPARSSPSTADCTCADSERMPASTARTLILGSCAPLNDSGGSGRASSVR